MLKDSQFKIIKEQIEEFFKKMKIGGEIEVKKPKDSTIAIDLKIEEPQILIGERGQTLIEIQHLLKVILRKKIKDQFYIDLDINNYKKKKIEYLKEMARSLADEVALLKKEKFLPPMLPYERRIIHLEIAERKDVTSQSFGEEPERKVVIKPYP